MNKDNNTTSTIHTEKYNLWNGKLQSRRKIIINAVKENFNHNIHNKWIIAILVITWIFIVFFPLLRASFGELSLMQDPDFFIQEDYENFDVFETYGISFPLSKTIQKNEIALYNITVMNTGEKPDNIYLTFSYVEEGWNSEFINIEENYTFYENEYSLNAGELKTFQIYVKPPDELEFGQGEVIISAISMSVGKANFQFSENIIIGADIRIITIVGKAEISPYQFNLITENTNITTKPNRKVESNIEIQNTGSDKDTYLINIDGLPEDWEYTIIGLEKTGDDSTITLEPGEFKTIKVIFDIPKYPLKNNNIGIVVSSTKNQFATKGAIIQIDVTDIPKIDKTSEILADHHEGLYGGMFILFVLLLSTVVGSKAISNDLSQKSFTIYFSRPIKKLDYVTIKYWSVASTLALVTLIPILVTYSGLVLLSNVGFDYFVNHLWVWGAIFIYSLLITVVFTSVVLAFSSFTKRRFYGAIGLVITYFITLIIAQIIGEEFNNDKGSAISIIHSLQIVGDKVFNISGVASDYSWYLNLSVLMVIIILSTIAVILKISRMELSE